MAEFTEILDLLPPGELPPGDPAGNGAAGVALDDIQAWRPRTKIQRGLAAALAPRVERAGKWLDSRAYGPPLRAGRDTVTY